MKKGDVRSASLRFMLRPASEDARGIIDPDTGFRRFRLRRHAPSDPVARFVDRYWVVTWHLDEPYTQEVLAHPVVNVVFGYGPATVNGVTTRMTSRTLEGSGWALGVMFRPAGFRPFLGRSMSTITDRVLPAAEVFGPAFEDVILGDEEELVAAVDAFLARIVPEGTQSSEETTRIVEQVAADPGLARVAALAGEVGLSVRQLQRRFADHVGMSPKKVVRRYRLYEAAERARKGTAVDWAALAVELGYSDQSHLTRDFSAAIGMPPERYAKSLGEG